MTEKEKIMEETLENLKKSKKKVEEKKEVKSEEPKENKTEVKKEEKIVKKDIKKPETFKPIFSKKALNSMSNLYQDIPEMIYNLKNDINKTDDRKRKEIKGKAVVFSSETSSDYFVEHYKNTQGGCMRENFFNIKNKPKTNHMEYYVKEGLEINDYFKKKLIDDFKKLGFAVREENKEDILETKDFAIQFVTEAIIENPLEDNKEYIIKHKSIKGGSFIAPKVFGNMANNIKGEPIKIHINECIPEMIKHKLPLLLFYKDRANMKSKSFKLEIKNFVLYVDNEVHDFDLKSYVNKLTYLSNCIKNKIIPIKEFLPYKKEDAFFLYSKKIIMQYQNNNINAGKKVYPFKCTTCSYFDICKNLEEGEIKE